MAGKYGFIDIKEELIRQINGLEMPQLEKGRPDDYELKEERAKRHWYNQALKDIKEIINR